MNCYVCRPKIMLNLLQHLLACVLAAFITFVLVILLEFLSHPSAFLLLCWRGLIAFFGIAAFSSAIAVVRRMSLLEYNGPQITFDHIGIPEHHTGLVIAWAHIRSANIVTIFDKVILGIRFTYKRPALRIETSASVKTRNWPGWVCPSSDDALILDFCWLTPSLDDRSEEHT